MGLIDKELQRKHATEERLIRFTEFVKEEKVKNSKGMTQACLQSEGYRDFYGKVVFDIGMHRSRWILPAKDNPKAVIFTKEIEAREYAEKLQKILRANGYPFSKAWPEAVAVRNEKPHPYSKFILPTVSYDWQDRYIILMRIW